jgi:hypothetical protein
VLRFYEIGFYMKSRIAGFDFHFGSLDDEKTPLASQYENLLYVVASCI